jgi:hypothetical protein
MHKLQSILRAESVTDCIMHHLMYDNPHEFENGAHAKEKIS